MHSILVEICLYYVVYVLVGYLFVEYLRYSVFVFDVICLFRIILFGNGKVNK